MAFTAATTGINSAADCETRLQLWLDAEQRLASAASISIGDRSLTRVDLPEVRAQIAYWRAQKQRFQAAAAGAGAGGFRVVKWSA